MKAKIVVTRAIPSQGLDLLSRECEVVVSREDRNLNTAEIIPLVSGADGMVCLLADKITPEVMAAAPQMKVIANYAAGFDNIDITEATRRGIKVTNTPDVLTETTADLAWALMMAVARRVVESDKFTRAGRFRGWEPMLFLGNDVYQSTLGVIGLGRIGRAFARRASGFNMKVLYYSRTRAPEAVEKSLQATYVPLEKLLKEADFVSLHAPLTPETRHIIGEKQLGMMKASACLINTARGPLVDEPALVRALQNGQLAGAALDVFEKEPEITPELLKMDNVVVLPHIGTASFKTREEMSVMVAQNVLAAIRGETPPNLVNREALK